MLSDIWQITLISPEEKWGALFCVFAAWVWLIPRIWAMAPTSLMAQTPPLAPGPAPAAAAEGVCSGVHPEAPEGTQLRLLFAVGQGACI